MGGAASVQRSGNIKSADATTAASQMNAENDHRGPDSSLRSGNTNKSTTKASSVHIPPGSNDDKGKSSDEFPASANGYDCSDTEKTPGETSTQSFESLTEEELEELIRKHPSDVQEWLTSLVRHMRDLVTLQSKGSPGEDLHEPLTQLNDIFVDKTRPLDRMMDFLARVGGAEFTVQLYVKHWKDEVDVTGLSDAVLEDHDEELSSALWCVFLMYGFWVDATDNSLEFAARLTGTGIVENVVDNLKKLEGKVETHKVMLCSLIGVIHNCARTRQKDYFRGLGTVQLMKPYLSVKDEGIKLLALLTLAYIADEEDFDLLRADAGMMVNLLYAVRSACEREERRDAVMQVKLEELLDGLGNLAQNDHNKRLLMDINAVAILKPILTDGRVDERQKAAQILWMLAFDEDNRKKMKEDRELMDSLERLEGDSKRLAKSCSGALWTLCVDSKTPKAGNQADSKSPRRAGRTKNGHVMISYQWSNQDKLLQIRDSLRTEGYRVWIDVDFMSGSTLQAMAEAVENADVVLVCMSRGYKDSPNCRNEAEYAYKLKKPIVPLLMERGYSPNGWLGILIGSKLFFDFSSKYPYDTSLKRLLKELATKSPQAHVDDAGGADVVDAAVPGPLVPAVQSTAPQEEVDSWLQRHQLGGCRKLRQLTWQNIKFLKKLRHSAPEFFFSHLSQQLNLRTSSELMNFCEAIESLS